MLFKGIRSAVVVLGIFTMILSASYAFGESAEVLPKGRSSIGITSKFYYPVTERFGPGGDAEDIASDYNFTLDSNAFPILTALDPAFGSTGAILGDSEVSQELDFNITEINYNYGLSDKVSIGIKIPYWQVKHDVKTNLNTINANTGKSPAFTSGADWNTNPPFIPIGMGGTPLTTQDILDLIEGGLDVDGDGVVDIAGYGFKEFDNWSKSGLGDIEAGARYQYHNSEDWRLACTGKLVFPTGWEDDPDNLVDYPSSSGAYIINIESNNDYFPNENLTLNGTFSYSHALPDSTKKRVVADVNQPISGTTQTVDRQQGGALAWEASAVWKIGDGYGITLVYKGGKKFKDDYESIAKALEEETDSLEHQLRIGLSYSTLPKFLRKEFPIPMVVSLLYRDRFAGENILKSRYLELGIGAYF